MTAARQKRMTAAKQKRLTTAELAEQHAKTIAELHNLNAQNEDLLTMLDLQQRAIEVLHQRLELDLEAREQTSLVLRDTLRHLFLLARAGGMDKIAQQLIPLGTTLNGYIPENDRATA